jgi:hypothetical protein
MKQETVQPSQASSNTLVKKSLFVAVATVFLVLIFSYYPFFKDSPVSASVVPTRLDSNDNDIKPKPVEASLSYKEKMNHIINGDSSGKWKVGETEPLAGAILPYKRIIAFYGNLYSKNMGILGELPKQEVLDKLQGEVKAWKKPIVLCKCNLRFIISPLLHRVCREGKQVQASYAFFPN